MSKPKNEVVTQDAKPEAAPAPALDGVLLTPTKIPPVGERQHKATFASDNRNGGYMIRVEGPNAEKFAKREVPVTRYDGTESVERCDKIVWTGNDKETGKKVALYKFIAHKRNKEAEQAAF